MYDCCLNRQFELGEKKYVEWQIIPNSKIDTIVVTEATYTVLRRGEVIKKGAAIVDGQKVSCLFEADTIGSFTLRIAVTVPPETIISDVFIDVVR